MSQKNFVERTEQLKRIFRFGYVGLCMMLLSATFDYTNDLHFSALLALLHAAALGIILVGLFFNLIKNAVAPIIITLNFFLVMAAFTEGLKSGVYLYILTLLFALPFIVGSLKINLYKVTAYILITLLSFCICILYCGETGRWQYISSGTYSTMFIFNSISATIMCAIFAFMGIYFELKYKTDLIEAKNEAEKHEQKIQKQNDHLQDIAFMNAHIVRSPLANILALTELIDINKIADTDNKEIITLLQTSAQQLDNNIREIVTKATGKETD